MNTNQGEFISRVIQVLCLGALIAGAFAVLRPFLPALIWAAIIVVATWPVLLKLQVVCRGHRRLAIALMSLGLLVTFVLPITWLMSTFITHAPQLKDLITDWLAGPLPAPPAWLARLPFGDRMAAEWQVSITRSPESWAEQIRPYALQSVQWLGSHVGSIGSLLLEFLLTLVLIVVLYVHGEAVAEWVRQLAHRVGGARGEESAVLASETMGAIAAGVVGTALAQSVISGMGLWIAGVPAAGVLTSVVFMLCIVQLGTLPVLLPAILWLFWRGDTGWAVALTAWAAALTIGDGFLRAWLIQRGAKLSLLLIMAGVIGGLLAFGVVGIFIGPILLAVALRLLNAWVDNDGAVTVPVHEATADTD
jgi:predicted PurR-regulated permease PerM